MVSFSCHGCKKQVRLSIASNASGEAPEAASGLRLAGDAATATSALAWRDVRPHRRTPGPAPAADVRRPAQRRLAGRGPVRLGRPEHGARVGGRRVRRRCDRGHAVGAAVQPRTHRAARGAAALPRGRGRRHRGGVLRRGDAADPRSLRLEHRDVHRDVHRRRLGRRPAPRPVGARRRHRRDVRVADRHHVPDGDRSVRGADSPGPGCSRRSRRCCCSSCSSTRASSAGRTTWATARMPPPCRARPSSSAPSSSSASAR